MQNTRGEKAVMLLGADPERVEVVGDLKFDALQPMTVEEKKYLRKTYKLHEETPVWIAGSTHAGEEEIILKAHEQLIAKHPNLVLILAPRRVERVKEVSALLQRKNISFVRRSLLKHKESPSVILLDTMGELTRVYALGQIAFVGRSLVKPGGGHSLIEPLSYGLAVLHGPFVENILHVSETVDSKGLAFQVKNAEELAQKVHSLLQNPSNQVEIAERAMTFLVRQQGTSKILADIAIKYLNTPKAG